MQQLVYLIDLKYRNSREVPLLGTRNFGCIMTIKMHFPFIYFNQFSENVGNVSDENGKRFQEDIQVMEDRYQRHSNINMMADCCWVFKKGKLKKKNITELPEKSKFVQIFE